MPWQVAKILRADIRGQRLHRAGTNASVQDMACRREEASCACVGAWTPSSRAHEALGGHIRPVLMLLLRK